MNSHHHFPVSTKAILFSPDYTEVLVMKYLWEAVRGVYGLPGGHVEKAEQPDDAIVRELKEELGIELKRLHRDDFWLHKNGKIVLIYSGTLSRNTQLIPGKPDGEVGVWVPLNDIKNGAITVGMYRDTILGIAKLLSRTKPVLE